MTQKEGLDMLSLSNLKQWLRQKQNTTMRDLQLEYGEEPTCIYLMLQHFILRGQVKESTITPKCGSKCQQCNPIYTLKFEWVA